MMHIKGISFTSDPHVRFKAGQVVFKEGEAGGSMYVLLNGQVDVLIGHKWVGTFEPVDLVGELSVIDPGPRSASVIAKTDCEMVLINQTRFKSLAMRHPEFGFHVMKVIGERLRWMAETTRSSKETAPATGAPDASGDAQAEIRRLKETIETQAQQIQELQELIEFIGQKEGLTRTK